MDGYYQKGSERVFCDGYTTRGMKTVQPYNIIKLINFNFGIVYLFNFYSWIGWRPASLCLHNDEGLRGEPTLTTRRVEVAMLQQH